MIPWHPPGSGRIAREAELVIEDLSYLALSTFRDVGICGRGDLIGTVTQIILEHFHVSSRIEQD